VSRLLSLYLFLPIICNIVSAMICQRGIGTHATRSDNCTLLLLFSACHFQFVSRLQGPRDMMVTRRIKTLAASC
jgi:hypothetical protein